MASCEVVVAKIYKKEEEDIGLQGKSYGFMAEYTKIHLQVFEQLDCEVDKTPKTAVAKAQDFIKSFDSFE
jgi:hypothetical protein